LRFVARYKKGIASVGLETINLGHPFYQIDGKDNIISFTTRQYIDYPLTIKGAGAGSEVTASGIFSDVIKASRASRRSIKWKK
jgi:aspartokinase/homoserine dehydrogenase 1